MSSSPTHLSSAATPAAAARGGSAGIVTGSTPRPRVPLFSAVTWSPLKVELFRSLWIATSIAQIGIWTREAAGPTLMDSLTADWPNRAEMVARVLVFSNLPICLFSVFAGALADVLDRRRLLIVTQLWMIAVSATLGLMTMSGMVHPATLLLMIFLLGMGTAAFGPALQAVLPELVPKEQFALAINLNSIALNVARAVGPAVFVIVVLIVPGIRGAGLSFILSGVSFAGALWVLFRWKAPPQRAAVAGEGFWNGIRAGFRYTVHSPANRAILLRVLTFIVPAVVIWSQVPIIATAQLGFGGTEEQMQRISALLFAFVGVGAILGVLLMPGLHARYKIDPVVNTCTAFFAIGLMLLSFAHTLPVAAVILVFLGVNWVIIPTNFNTATQKSVPPWVKGRAISFYLTVLFGSFAIGGKVWGAVSTHYGIHTSLLSGGIAMLAALLFARWFPLTLNEGLKLVPAYDKGSMPPSPGLEGLYGNTRVEVATQYAVPPGQEKDFFRLMRRVGQQRKRNGASRYRLSAGQGPGRWVETIVYRSRAEYERQPARLTKEDLLLHAKAEVFLAIGDYKPVSVRGENLWL